MRSLKLAEVTTMLRLLRKSMGGNTLYKLMEHIEAEKNGVPIPQTPRFKAAEDMMTDAGRLPPMLIERLLPDHSLFLLTGKPKAGKSFFALDIADCVSRGLPVFDTLVVNRPGPVLYLAMEDGPTELSRRLSQRGFKRGEHTLYFIDEAFSLTDALHYARIREQAQALQPSLIVIDTAAEALDIRDWINRSEILAKIAPIRRLAREICTVLLVAHNRKAEGDMGDEIAGSNALAGAVDGWISAHKVERRENGNRRLFLRVEGRGGVGHEMVTEMDHETLRFSLIPPGEVEADAGSVRRGVFVARREERHALALKTMYDLGAHATIAELAAAMGITYKSAWVLVREMAALGKLEECPDPEISERGTRRAPLYRLCDTNEGTVS